MRAAKASDIETTFPGASRRRAWAHPEVASHSLVVLTFEELRAAPLSGVPEPGVLEAVEHANLDELLGPLAVVIDLADVRGAKLDLLANSLVVEYAAGSMDPRTLTLVFATPEVADACFTKLWRRLGDAYQLQPYRRDPWSAARSPLLLLAAALVATAAMALTLSVFEDMASARAASQAGTVEAGESAAVVPPKSLLESLLGWMDWRWVCAAGGAVAAVAQVWMYRRLTRPPLSLEVKRS